MAEQMGLQGLAIPEEFGGSGYSFVELGVVLEEMGRALLCAPYFSTVVLAANTLLHSATTRPRRSSCPASPRRDDRHRRLHRAVNGKWDEAGITMDGDEGRRRLDAQRHEDVRARRPHRRPDHRRRAAPAGVSLFAVDGDAAGLTRTPLSTMDQTRKQAKLEFSGTPATLLGTEGERLERARRCSTSPRSALAAEQVGGAQYVLEMAVEYAKVRVQFGRPIGSFQAIKHKCADMLLEVESAKSAAYYACGARPS